jgi:nucleoside phosphorylase
LIIFVEELEGVTSRRSSEPLIITPVALFLGMDPREYKRAQYTFVHCNAGLDTELDAAVDWIENYTSKHAGRVITNFDEQRPVLADAPLSYQRLVDKTYDRAVIENFAGTILADRVEQVVQHSVTNQYFGAGHIGSAEVASMAQRGASPQVEKKAVALLITAVGSERTAVLELLREDYGIAPTLEEIDGRYFNRFQWPGRDRIWDVLLGQPTEKGGPAAQALLHSVVQAQAPAFVLMVGMCGGLPENGAKEGMVVLGRQVFNYEPARLREGTLAWSPTAYRSTAKVLDLANALIAEGGFGSVEVKTTKDYASGAKLIDDLSSDLRQKIIALSGDVLAFEMEAPDLLHAVWELERTVRFAVGIAKGVSDFGDGKLRDGKEARQRAATRNAAHVALKLLEAY